VFFQQTTEVEDRGFVWNTLQAQPSQLARDGSLLQRFFHRRIAVAIGQLCADWMRANLIAVGLRPGRLRSPRSPIVLQAKCYSGIVSHSIYYV
jgi:hypothetical protein